MTATTDTTALTPDTTHEAEGKAEAKTVATPVADTQQQLSEGETAPDGNDPADGITTDTESEAEPYELTTPDGVNLDTDVLTDITGLARELKLDKDGAQKMLHGATAAMQRQLQATIEATRAEWVVASQADKEIGGDKLQENLSVGVAALKRFGSPKLTALLNETGLGDHPEMIRFAFKVGKAISEDNILSHSPSRKEENLNDPAVMARRMFPNSET